MEEKLITIELKSAISNDLLAQLKHSRYFVFNNFTQKQLY